MTPDPTPRQEQILLLVGEGLSNKEIADRIGLGERTVKHHTDRLRAKLGVKKKRELIPIARAWEVK